jgi:hypothetical protein
LQSSLFLSRGETFRSNARIQPFQCSLHVEEADECFLLQHWQTSKGVIRLLTHVLHLGCKIMAIIVM